MKIGSEMPKVVAALERTGLTERAVYVAKATMREQRIVSTTFAKCVASAATVSRWS